MGQFDRPRCATAEAFKGVGGGTTELVAVSDTANYRVQIFKPDGTPVRILGDNPGKEPESFDDPQQVQTQLPRPTSTLRKAQAPLFVLYRNTR